jgi:hypothetical protein
MSSFFSAGSLLLIAPIFVFSLPQNQGDQIGRIFAYLTVVYFGQILKITEVAQIIGHPRSHLCTYVDKNGLNTF